MKKFVTINKKWNKEKYRCECLIKENCFGNSFFNVAHCSCEMKKVAALIEEEECDVETNNKIKNKTVLFFYFFILFACVSVITTGNMVYFCLKSRNISVLHY